MNKSNFLQKLKRKVTSKVGIAIITGFICFNVGAMIMISGGNNSDRVKELEEKNAQLESNKKDLETKNNDLQIKVDEAKPWFDMKDQEQKEAMAQAEKEKQERLAKEEEQKKKEVEEAERKKKEEAEAKKKQLGNGNWTCGTDFEPGTYNLIAVKGGGNVICIESGLNAIMGIKNDDFYQKEYSNIKFKEGDVLTINRVTIDLIPVAK